MLKKVPFFVVISLILIHNSIVGKSLLKEERLPTTSFSIPVNIPVSFSGNYGEIRATHFHSGVDIRVGGVVGESIISAGDGYISRISVSPTGYGNAIYINHPNGKTTLYGHLHDFAPHIQKFIREEQYNKNSFSINIELDSTHFKVKKGDFIGRAGNSGSSGGPHLHFEVRETISQIPMNPKDFINFKSPDNISPTIERVAFYAIDFENTLPQTSHIASFSGPTSQTILLPQKFYIAVQGVDRQNGTNARLAIKHYNYYLNDQLIFSFSPENIPFSKGRYVNSILEYPQRNSFKRSMVKSWVEPGCGLTDNIISINEGIFILDNFETKNLKIELIDHFNNKTTQIYKVKRDSTINRFSDFNLERIDSNRIMPWYIPNRFIEDDIRVFLPQGSLYSSILLNYNKEIINGKDTWKVHNANTPIHNSYLLALKVDSVKDGLSDKLCIIALNPNGSTSYVGGKYQNGWIESRVSFFGNFQIAYDTIAPTITPSFSNGANLSSRNSVRITISDNLSGISEYNVYIDNEWNLAEYDPKNRALNVHLSADKLKKGKEHIMEIIVSDNRGNVNRLKRKFIW